MIQKLINDKLLAEQEEHKERIRSGLFNPSKFGRCYYCQILNRKNIQESNPPNIELLKQFRQGTYAHLLNQSYLPRESCEVRIEEEDILGFADVALDAVYDIKSTEYWKYKKYWNIPTYLVIKNNYEAFLQVAYYGLRLFKKEAIILPVPFGTFVKLEHKIIVSEWEDDVECELYHLRMYWDTEAPKEARAYGGNECNYCSYRDYCKGQK